MWRYVWLLAALSFSIPAYATNVLTYHYDNLRTGWNQAETTLTPSSVASGNFTLLAQIPLDEQVDAQPLFVAGQSIAGGVHDVVYIATQNNSIYAIDANSGAVLLQQNFGMPVPIQALPIQCNNNSYNVGITSTPVIDTATNTLYAITYTYENSVQTYRIHAIDLSTLQDQIPSVVVTAGAVDTLGKTISFNAASQRQRPGLVETSGAIYAGFGSFCDVNASTSRGWVLGWQAATLTLLHQAKAINLRAKSPHDYFLSSVWMSGYGIAADDAGSLYFATGNSDYSGTTYSPVTNIDESVVRLSADLITIQDYFTPTGTWQGWSNFDKSDWEFGSGGVLLLPTQSGATPNLVVASGKGGPLYLLNRDSLGGNLKPKAALGHYPNIGCWCGHSYYTGADGIGRVVQRNSLQVVVYRIATSPTPALVQESVSAMLSGTQQPGFFTSVSSNGTTPGTAIIWAVTRPSSQNADPFGISLVAMDPAQGAAQIYSAEAGSWVFAASAMSNTVPITANGHVFVASYGNLSIFGLAAHAAVKHHYRPVAPQPPPILPGAPHEWHGVITASGATSLTLKLRDGSARQISTEAAYKAGAVLAATPGGAAAVRGHDGPYGTLAATSVLHLLNQPAFWPPDR